MKTYFLLIKFTQLILLGISIIILATLPAVLVFYPDFISYQFLYFLAHTSLFFVMIIRPLADIMTKTTIVRPLVILRKGIGVFSASIIVSFILSKIIVDPTGYLASFGTTSYWTLKNLTLFAHLADISAIILLVTSNNLSKRILGANWKRIQKLSYVYFYGSGLYVVFILKDYLILFYLIIVTILTLVAYQTNKKRRLLTTQN